MTTQPRCPNHGVGLVDCDFAVGVGICPISGARFKFDANAEKKNSHLRLSAAGDFEQHVDWHEEGPPNG